MSPDTFPKRKSGWISEIFAENTVHYLQESKHAWMALFLLLSSVAFCRQRVVKPKVKLCFYTATSWFPMVSASCTIDPTETRKCFHLMENAFTKIYYASIIKQMRPKRNKFGFPLTFSYCVNKKRNMTFWTLPSGKKLNA